MLHVLIIDSEKDRAAQYERFLSESKYTAVVTEDGLEGVRRFYQERFDLVLAYWKCAKISGPLLLKQLQGGLSDLPCPVLVYSDHIDVEFENLNSHSKKIHLLVLPVDRTVLFQKIQNIVRRSQNAQASKIDVRLVNPVLEATVSVLTELTQFRIEVGKPFLKEKNQPSGDISGLVGVISSSFRGNISLSFWTDGYLKLVSRMLGENYTQIDDENKDAVAEILNMIFGLAKTALNDSGMDIKSAIPTIVRGASHTLEHHPLHPTLVIPFSSPEMGEFRAEVSSTAD